MTTSGTITSSMTGQQMLVLAMEDLGVLGAGEIPSAEEGASALLRLNWMLKTWQAKGVNLWREATAEVVIPAGSRYGAISPTIQAITGARVVTDGFERPLARFERDDYMSLPNKGSTGVPTIFYPEKGVSGLNLYLWPIPRADATIAIDFGRVIEDVTDLTQTVDVPQEWAETVWVNWAARLANTFGASRVDPSATQRITAYAASLEQLLLDQDRPASIYMGPYRQGRRRYV